MTAGPWFPKVPGVTIDRIDVAAGLRELVACGYDDDARTTMVIEHSLQLWARGEEVLAEKKAIDRSFHGIDLVCWLRVLAAARAAGEAAAAPPAPEPEQESDLQGSAGTTIVGSRSSTPETRKADQPMSNSNHTFVVTVSGCTPEQARQVIAERINHDEDYGFTYSIGYGEEQASAVPNYAITLDAESVKAEMQDRFDHGGDPDLTQSDVDTVLAASDERISQLINNVVDDSFWSEYDNVRSRVINQLLAEAP